MTKPAKRSKYGNRRVEADGITFDSLAEHRRYRSLKLLQAAGEISNLEVHPRYELQSSFRRHGKTHRTIAYEADFRYLDLQTSRLVVEDVKGAQTQVFRLKMRMLLFKYPEIDFRLIKSKDV